MGRELRLRIYLLSGFQLTFDWSKVHLKLALPGIRNAASPGLEIFSKEHGRIRDTYLVTLKVLLPRTPSETSE